MGSKGTYLSTWSVGVAHHYSAGTGSNTSSWIGPGIRAVHTVKTERLAEFLEKHEAVFQNKPGVMTEHTTHLTLQPGTRPVFLRPNSVTFGIKRQVREKLARLEEAGILRRAEYSLWAAPIVIVIVHKKDGGIHLCGKYKTMLPDDAKKYMLV